MHDALLEGPGVNIVERAHVSQQELGVCERIRP